MLDSVLDRIDGVVACDVGVSECLSILDDRLRREEDEGKSASKRERDASFEMKKPLATGRSEENTLMTPQRELKDLKRDSR